MGTNTTTTTTDPPTSPSVPLRYSIISSSSTFGIFMYVLSSLWLLALLRAAVMLVRERHTKAVARKSPLFMGFIVLGSAFMTLGVLLQYASPSLGVCLSQVWFVAVGFVLAYGSATAKNWRIWYIFSNPSMQTFAITNLKLFLTTLAPGLVIMVVLLIGWSGASPFTLTQVQVSAAHMVYVDVVCASSSPVWPAVTFGYAMIILASTAAISVMIQRISSKSRHVSDYNESLALGMACLGVCTVQVLAASMMIGFVTDIDSRSASLSVLIFIPAVALPIAVFTPLVWSAWTGTLDMDSVSGSRSGNVNHRSTSTMMSFFVSTTTPSTSSDVLSTILSVPMEERKTASGSKRRHSSSLKHVTHPSDVAYFYAALDNVALVEQAIWDTLRAVTASSDGATSCCRCLTLRNGGSSDGEENAVDVTGKNRTTDTTNDELRTVALDAVARIRAAGPSSTTILRPHSDEDPAAFGKYEWFRVPFVRRLHRYMRSFRAAGYYQITFGHMMGRDTRRLIETEREMLAQFIPNKNVSDEPTEEDGGDDATTTTTTSSSLSSSSTHHSGNNENNVEQQNGTSSLPPLRRVIRPHEQRARRQRNREQPVVVSATGYSADASDDNNASTTVSMDGLTNK